LERKKGDGHGQKTLLNGKRANPTEGIHGETTLRRKNERIKVVAPKRMTKLYCSWKEESGCHLKGQDRSFAKRRREKPRPRQSQKEAGL